MPYLDLWLRECLTVLSRIVWHYDSSGVQAKKYYGSLYEPILFCVKDPQNYTFNANDIEVEAKTGAKRKLITVKQYPPLIKALKFPEIHGIYRAFVIECQSMNNTLAKNLKPY